MPAAAASATEVDSSAFDRLRAIYISDDAQLTLMTSTSISLLLSNRQDSCFRVDSINLQQLFFWLKVACRIDFKLAFLVYKCLHGLSPSYLAEELHHPAESEFWRRLRSASCHELSVPGTRLSTYGDRAFPVAAVRIWNSLPQHITSAPSLPVFRCRLKTYSSKSVTCSLLSCLGSDTVIKFYGNVNRSYLLTFGQYQIILFGDRVVTLSDNVYV